jgi:signal transduction histidine kinase
VYLEVQYTGTGIPAGLAIFSAFVTTKAEGMGFGLAIVKQIVDAHGGTITYSSNVGQGTTLRVALPIHVSRLEENG